MFNTEDQDLHSDLMECYDLILSKEKARTSSGKPIAYAWEIIASGRSYPNGRKIKERGTENEAEKFVSVINALLEKGAWRAEVNFYKGKTGKPGDRPENSLQFEFVKKAVVVMPEQPAPSNAPAQSFQGLGMAESLQIMQQNIEASYQRKMDEMQNAHNLEKLNDKINSLTAALENEKREASKYEEYAERYQLEAERLKAENEALKKGNVWEKVAIAAAGAVAPTVLHNIGTNGKLAHLKGLGSTLAELLAPIPEGTAAQPLGDAPSAPAAPPAPAISQRLLDMAATFPWIETCGEEYYMQVMNLIKSYQDKYFDKGQTA